MTPPPQPPTQQGPQRTEIDFDAYAGEMQQQIAAAVTRAGLLAGENAALKRRIGELTEQLKTTTDKA